MTKQNIYFRHDSFRKNQDTIIKDIYKNIFDKKSFNFKINIKKIIPTGQLPLQNP